jgi:hypothetical protein
MVYAKLEFANLLNGSVMFELTLDDSNQIDVRYKNHLISYGLDGKLPNPLEATYAALAGCAGVYSRKACKTLGISSEGIEINCKPVVRVGNALVPSRFVTEVRFPERITIRAAAKYSGANKPLCGKAVDSQWRKRRICNGRSCFSVIIRAGNKRFP